MVAQAGLFASALVAHQLGSDWVTIPDNGRLEKLIGKALSRILAAGAKREGSWATLLKSQLFYEEAKKQLRVVPTKKADVTSLSQKRQAAK